MGAFKIPKTIGQCADKLYEIKQERLAKQHEVEELEKQERLLKEHIINTLPKSQASGVAGKHARVMVVTKEIPQVKDWDAFGKYVLKHKSLELLQKRLSDAAIKERLDAGEKLPGVEIFNATTVSINKL